MVGKIQSFNPDPSVESILNFTTLTSTSSEELEFIDVEEFIVVDDDKLEVEEIMSSLLHPLISKRLNNNNFFSYLLNLKKGNFRFPFIVLH